MSDVEILAFIQLFGCKFRHGLNGECLFTWIDVNGYEVTTAGVNLRAAVMGASMARKWS